MKRLLRTLLGIPPATIGCPEALAIARTECLRRNYAWRGPVMCDERLRGFWIATNLRSRGGNIGIVVGLDGSVERFQVSPRYVTVTRSVYLHIFEAKKREAATKLDALFAETGS